MFWQPRHVASAEAVFETAVEHWLVVFHIELLPQPVVILEEAVYERLVSVVVAILRYDVKEVSSALASVGLQCDKSKWTYIIIAIANNGGR